MGGSTEDGNVIHVRSRNDPTRSYRVVDLLLCVWRRLLVSDDGWLVGTLQTFGLDEIPLAIYANLRWQSSVYR